MLTWVFIPFRFWPSFRPSRVEVLCLNTSNCSFPSRSNKAGPPLLREDRCWTQSHVTIYYLPPQSSYLFHKSSSDRTQTDFCTVICAQIGNVVTIQTASVQEQLQRIQQLREQQQQKRRQAADAKRELALNAANQSDIIQKQVCVELAQNKVPSLWDDIYFSYSN